MGGPKDPVKNKEWRDKLAAAKRGRPVSQATRDKNRANAIANRSGYGSKGRRNPGSLGSFEHIAWIEAVMQRDNFTCRHCGAKENLAAHHIVRWNDDPALRFVVDNGLTLCRSCHSREHIRLGHLVHKGGVEKNPNIRWNMRYRIWRQAVLERDNRICFLCGKAGADIARHIVHWDADTSKRFDVDNGATMCRSCHGRNRSIAALINQENNQPCH